MFVLSALLIGCGEEPTERIEETQFDNLPPYSAVIDLEPATPYTNDDLEALIVAESTDPNDDAVTVEYYWYKDDELQADLTEANIGADLTEVGQTWTVEVIATDGTLQSAASTRSVTIRNSPPSVTASLQWVDGDGNVSADLDAPGADSTLGDFAGYHLQVVAEGSDIDANDEVTFEYAWTLNGEDAGIDEDTLEESAMDRGQEWTVSITATDGLVDSDPVELSFSFYNAMPMIDAVSMMPTMPYLGDSVECMATATDEDDTELTYAYTWTITSGVDEEGNPITTESMDNPLDTSTLIEGDSIQCSATASDGRDESESMMSESATLTTNTAPSISEVSITSPAVVDSMVTCSSTYSDTESATEDLMVSFEWTDATGVSLGDTDTLDLSGTTLSEDDSLTCTITVDDGNMQTQGNATTTLVAP